MSALTESLSRESSGARKLVVLFSPFLHEDYKEKIICKTTHGGLAKLRINLVMYSGYRSISS